MAGTEEVTLRSSCHLPAHGIARRVSSREDGASQAEEKRPIWAFLVSQARRKVLHERSLAREAGQGTKHKQAASREPGLPLCGQPNTPLTSPFQRSAGPVVPRVAAQLTPAVAAAACARRPVPM